jgi:hypothetical protein
VEALDDFAPAISIETALTKVSAEDELAHLIESCGAQTCCLYVN